MARVAVFSLVRGKPDLMERSFRGLRRNAGIEFDHFVIVNDFDGSETHEWMMDHQDQFACVLLPGKNLGISIGTNLVIDEIWRRKREDMSKYDYILKYDPDNLPKSRRFLKRMVRFADACVEANDPTLVCPNMLKLKHPVPAIASGVWKPEDSDIEEPFDIVTIGGQCLLHPSGFWEGWRHDPYLAMSWGQDEQVARRLKEMSWGFARLRNVRVEHAYGTDEQAKLYPEEFGFTKELRMHFSYGLGL